MDNTNDFETTVNDFLVYLENKGFNEKTIENYRCSTRKIRVFLKKKEIQYFDAVESAAFIENILSGLDYHNASKPCRLAIRCATALVEYQTTGVVSFRVPKKDRIKMDGEFGYAIESYLKYREEKNYSSSTNANHLKFIQRFYYFVEDHGVKELPKLSQEMIINYVESLAFCSQCTINGALASLRCFLKYLYDIGKTEIDLSYAIPKSNYVKSPNPPDTYSQEEIKMLLDVIDRANAKGKRDYAMILLAVRLGLRASDICRLEFKHLDWEKNLITLCQFKTGNPVNLPLLPEVGNAIIDYLKYGRPKSDEPYVFLSLKPLYRHLVTATLKTNVNNYMYQAGIDCTDGRKKGVHVLRHSLAGRMLEKHIPLPIITEVLGHSNANSTMYYLRMDMEQLKHCALEVDFSAIGGNLDV